MTRRELFTGAAALSAAAAVTNTGCSATAKGGIKKSILITMLPDDIPLLERFKLAVELGFHEMEVRTVEDDAEAQQIKDAADKAGLRIHSVMNSAHWKYPLSSADPAVVAESMKGMETSLKNAQLWGADTVLLVPAVVNPQTSYKDAWTRSQAQIRKLIPMAEKMKVVIGIEEVWNKFLLSPLEMARYVDEFKSPWVRAYVDVGNMVFYGYPQDWIRTLNKRICKLHFKDFRFKDMKADFVNLREGDIDWKEVYKALAEVGYKGSATVELEGGDLPYLKDVSRRVDLILTGA